MLHCTPARRLRPRPRSVQDDPAFFDAIALIGDALPWTGGASTVNPDLPPSARFTATLAADATMTLQVNDQPAVAGRAAKLIGRQPQEDFCLGHDNAKPVTEYHGGPFQGRITDLKLTTP